jgi:2-aminoadipate transaminase
VLIDAGSRVLVETPTYLGALQAFTPMEPEVVSVASDDEGVLIDDLSQGGRRRQGALPVCAAQLPEPHRPHHERSPPRRAGRKAAAELGLPLVEDNPYGDLWFDNPPPRR